MDLLLCSYDMVYNYYQKLIHVDQPYHGGLEDDGMKALAAMVIELLLFFIVINPGRFQIRKSLLRSILFFY